MDKCSTVDTEACRHRPMQTLPHNLATLAELSRRLNRDRRSLAGKLQPSATLWQGSRRLRLYALTEIETLTAGPVRPEMAQKEAA